MSTRRVRKKNFEQGMKTNGMNDIAKNESMNKFLGEETPTKTNEQIESVDDEQKSQETVDVQEDDQVKEESVMLPSSYTNCGIRSLWYPDPKLSLFYAFFSEQQRRNPDNTTELSLKFYKNKSKCQQFDTFYEFFCDQLKRDADYTDEDYITHLECVYRIPINVVEFDYTDIRYTGLFRLPLHYKLIRETDQDGEVLTLVKIHKNDWTSDVNKESITKLLSLLDIDPKSHADKIDEVCGECYYFPIKHMSRFESKFTKLSDD